MGSQLYVQVPADYGDFWKAGPGTPLLRLLDYGAATSHLLNLHLQMVLYSKRQRTDGFIHDGVALALCRPLTPQTARRDCARLAEAGYIEVVKDGYHVPAALAWPVVRTGKRDRIPDRIREWVYERDGYLCVECGSGDGLSLDHVVPWSKYGSDEEKNLRTLCGSCNSAKGARD